MDPSLLRNTANESPKPPNSAIVEKRHSTLPIDSSTEQDGVKTIPQIELLGHEFANKTSHHIKEEIATRDDIIGIDEEDEQAHHHDFDDDEEASCGVSACDDGIDDGFHNQSVDSEGKVGGKRVTSRSLNRHMNMSEMQSHNLATANVN